MNPIVLANIISLAGCLLMVAIGLIRERKKILLTQCVQWIILTISHLMLGGVTAAMSPLAAMSLLVFSLLYTPCVAAIASIKRELGGKWAAGVVAWQCVIAWAAALIVRLVGMAFGLM